MASGHVNRTKGRTHGCTDQLAGVKKVLANSEPSTHGDMSALVGIAPLAELPHAGVQHLVGMKAWILAQ